MKIFEISLLVLFVLVLSATAQTELGCFGQKQNSLIRALNITAYQIKNVTQCIDFCRKAKQPYAGLEMGDTCLCGKNHDKHGMSKGCNMTCASGEICGGYFAITVYSVNPCKPNLCKNGGTCLPGMSGDYTCKCLVLFEGKNCEKFKHCGGLRTDPCRPNPCQNGAECINIGLSVYYKCICPLGYSGKHCTEYRNDCTDETCKNNGTCIPRGIHGYHCKCYPGFKGRNCEGGEADPYYIGCYKDRRNRDLSRLISNDINGIPDCIRKCKEAGFTFCGLQYKTECWCGDTYGKYGPANNCNFICRSFHGHCGDYLSNSIYKTGYVATVQ